MALPTSPPLKRLYDLDEVSPTFPSDLGVILYSPQYNECREQLSRDDQAWLLEYLDRVRYHCRPSSPPLKLP